MVAVMLCFDTNTGNNCLCHPAINESSYNPSSNSKRPGCLPDRHSTRNNLALDRYSQFGSFKIQSSWSVMRATRTTDSENRERMTTTGNPIGIGRRSPSTTKTHCAIYFIFREGP